MSSFLGLCLHTTQEQGLRTRTRAQPERSCFGAGQFHLSKEPAGSHPVPNSLPSMFLAGRALDRSRRNGLNCSTFRDSYSEGAGSQKEEGKREKKRTCLDITTKNHQNPVRTRDQTAWPKCPQLWSTPPKVPITKNPTSKTPITTIAVKSVLKNITGERP